MRDQNKTKKQLINELAELRQRVDELEALEKERKETAKALRESEGQFGLVADSLPVLISYVDWQQCYRFNNKAYERWFGHLREKVYGNHIKEVLGEPAYEVIRQYVETALSGQEVSFESWVFYKDGGNRYIRAIYIPHFGEKGEVKGFFALVDDLTEHRRKDEELERYEQSLEKLVEERTAKLILAIKELQGEIDEHKQAEENLQQERDLLNHITETSPAGITVVNREGRVTFANARAEVVLGLKKDEIAQRTYNDPEWRITAFDGSPLPDEELPFQRVMTTGLPIYDERHAIEWPNGRRVLLSVNAAPLFDSHGRADGMVATVEDITERIRMEEELRESEEKYKKLVEESLQGLIIGQGLPPRIIFANSTTSEILGYSKDELVSFSPEEVKELIHPEGRTIFFQQYQERLEGKEVPSRYEIRGIRKDGTVRWTELLARRIEYQGKPAVLATFVDITERKRAEDLLKTERDLGLALSTTAGLDETLSLCFDAAIRVSGMDCGGIYLVDETSGSLNLVFHKGLSDDFVKSVSHYNADSVNAALVMAGKPIYSHHQELGVPLDEAEYRAGLRAIAVIPVQFEDRVIACLNISSYTLDEVPDFARTALETIATQIGNAIIWAKTEETLRTSEANLSALIENTNDWICSIDSEYRVIAINKAFKKMFSFFSKMEVEKGMNIMGCIPPEQRSFWADIQDRALGGEHFSFEDHYGHEGVSVDVEVSVNPIIGEDRKITGASYFFRDITERKRAEDALRESEARYRALIESQMDLISRYRPDGTLTFVNDAYCQFYRKTREELIGHSFLPMVAPEFHELVLKETENLVKDPRPIGGEYLNYKQNGEACWIQWVVQGIVDENGRVVELQAVGRDITRLKQTEQILRQSEENYRDLYENAPNGYFTVNTEGRVGGCNRYLAEMLGYNSADEIVGTPVEDLYADTPHGKSKVQQIFQNVRAGESVRDEELQMQKRDGAPLWTSLTINAERDDEGQFRWTRSMVVNITERKQAEEALRNSEAQLSNAMKIARLSYWEYDVASDLFTFNDQFYSIFRTAAEREGGYKMPSARYAERFVHPDDMWVVGLEIQKALETTDPHYSRHLEHRVIWADGETGYIAVRLSVVKDDQGRTVKTYGANQDITERKGAEEQLRSSQEQLRALSAHLQSIREEERTLIAREIHDELGQELTGLKMDLSWLSKRVPEGQELVMKKTESMLKLVDTTIQSVRRISTQLRPGVLDDLGLTAAIEWQAQDFQTRTMIQCEFRSNLKEVDLDRDRSTTIFRILQETLTNVARHASATRVNIYLNEAAASLVLIVEDNGRGITEKEILDAKSLGLLGMRERALVFGGEVKISGAPGKGTTITLKIPLQK